MKICPVEPRCSTQTDRQPGRHEETNSSSVILGMRLIKWHTAVFGLCWWC